MDHTYPRALLIILTAATLPILSWAGESAVYQVELEPQPLSDALKSFADQTGLQIMFFSELTDGVQTATLVGDYTADAALDTLLDSSGLTYEYINERAITVRATNAVSGDEGGDSDSKNSPPTPVLMAQVQTTEQAARSLQQSDSQSRNDESRVEDAPLEEIIVTGTNIRGIAPESSPVRTFNREDILNSGAATAQDFIQTLPLNFGGGSNATASFGLPNDDSSQFNSSLGSSVNLRGLGSGSTLVLLNGRRLAPSSSIGDFVDISLIPASAIERVEVLSDGASAIYGADAIAGVVNFVLRDDYDGVEAAFRYGTVTDGDHDEYRASFTAGKNWETGNALVSYEYFSQDNLSAEDREFSQDAALPNDLLPGQERHSVLASVRQELSPDFEVFGDLLYSERESEQTSFSILLSEEFQDLPSTENLSLSGGGSWKLSNTWYAEPNDLLPVFLQHTVMWYRTWIKGVRFLSKGRWTLPFGLQTQKCLAI